MNGIVFNFHDVALLLVAGECGMLAILYLAHRGDSPRAQTLLAVFLLMNMLIAIDTLIYWGEAFRYWIFHISPDLFFIFGFAYFLQGPALYFYIRSMDPRNLSFGRLHLLHLIPAIAAQIYLYLVYHCYPADIQGDLVLNQKIFSVTGGCHDVFVALQKSVAVVYGIACYFVLLRGRAAAARHSSKIKRSIVPWLYLLACGFLLSWTWNLVTHFVGVYRPGTVSEVMGVAGNYISLLLISLLMFYSLLHLEVLGSGNPVQNLDRKIGPEPIDPRFVERIKAAMESDKLFLNPRLTVDEFATHLALPSRQVSAVIKRCFGCNFLEYVNSYRVQQAKADLADPDNRNEPILNIASRSGFNSKATFNRFFKKFAGVTPTEYRRCCLSGMPD